MRPSVFEYLKPGDLVVLHPLQSILYKELNLETRSPSEYLRSSKLQIGLVLTIKAFDFPNDVDKHTRSLAFALIMLDDNRFGWVKEITLSRVSSARNDK